MPFAVGQQFQLDSLYRQFRAVGQPQLRFAADRITDLTDGAAVTTWSDLSGWGRNATQADPAKKPIYKTGIINGRPVVRGDNIDDRMTFSLPLLSTMTVLAVIRTGAALAANAVFMSSGEAATPGIRWAFCAGSSATQGYGWGGAATVGLGSGAGRAVNTVYLQSYVKTVAAWAVFSNGAAVSTPADASAPTDVWSGALFQEPVSGGTSYPFNGDIAEIIAYGWALTNGQRRTVERYLASKYGLVLT